VWGGGGGSVRGEGYDDETGRGEERKRGKRGREKGREAEKKGREGGREKGKGENQYTYPPVDVLKSNLLYILTTHPLLSDTIHYDMILRI
jgi:hypothetical protein